MESTSQRGLRGGTIGNGVATLKYSTNALKIKKIMLSYSNGEFEMNQPEWDRLDRIDTLVFQGKDLSTKEQAYIDKLLKRAYDRPAII